ncbi:MAG: DUF4252 domain-containing protein [Flavobacteriaceae bacterium]|nr:DUF4252 domain-containing protein [Flavobacteriaceae bacterium]
MKNASLLMSFLLYSCLLSAQDIFEEFQKDPEASYISVSPKMFEMLGKLSINTDDPKMNGFFEMVQSMKHFKVLSTKNPSIAEKMDVWLTNQLVETDLETVLNLTEQEVEVQFCVVFGEQESKVDQLVMFVKGAQKFADQEGLDVSNLDFILLFIEGKIDLNQVATLTEIVDIPGGNFLKKMN